jgi:PAS domain S-box-containing protein
MIEGIVDYAIYMLDTEGRVASWNSGAQRIKGYTADEVIGQHFSRFYTIEEIQQNKPQSLLQMATRNGRVEDERWGVRKDGSHYWANGVITALRDPNGSLRGFSCITRDVTERKQAEQTLRESELKFHQIADNIQETFWIRDPDTQRMLYISPACEKIFDRPASEFVEGKISLFDILYPEDVQYVRQNYIQSTREGMEQEYRIFRRDGSVRWIRARAFPVRDEKDQVRRVVGLAEDTTERKRTEIRLRDLAAELARSNRELEDFAYIASHDLQEPLRKILTFGDRLKMITGDALNDQGRDYLDRMQKAAGRMQILIEGLLTYSRVTTKAEPFSPVNLTQIAQDILSDLELQLEQTHGQIELGALPTIEADPTQMRQLFQNLINNALKFHRADTAPRVKIQSNPVSDSANGGHYEIVIVDNGIGFEEKYNTRIFEVFERLHGRGEYEGSGIGLAICRKIVERHNGRIVASGVPGQGATFTMTLPAKHN